MYCATVPGGSGLPHCRGFTITTRLTALGRPTPDEWSVRHGDLYLTTHNTHKRQAFMILAGFQPAFPESKRPQTHALDLTTSEINEDKHWPELYLLVDECKTNLLSLAILFHLLCTQRVSDINISIFRRLRLY